MFKDVLRKYWLHIICLLLIAFNITLSLLYFTQKPQKCEVCEKCEGFDISQYIVENTEDYLKYVKSIQKFLLQMTIAIVKDTNLRNAFNNSDSVKHSMYTDETESEVLAMLSFLHSGSVAKTYKFNQSLFSQKYNFPSTISYVNSNDPNTTGINGITLFLQMLLTNIEKGLELKKPN